MLRVVDDDCIYTGIYGIDNLMLLDTVVSMMNSYSESPMACNIKRIGMLALGGYVRVAEDGEGYIAVFGLASKYALKRFKKAMKMYCELLYKDVCEDGKIVGQPLNPFLQAKMKVILDKIVEANSHPLKYGGSAIMREEIKEVIANA